MTNTPRVSARLEYLQVGDSELSAGLTDTPRVSN